MPTTPAQIFHLLRRQMLRHYRKPLIVMSPKSLLRHKEAVSTLEELADGKFQTVIGEVDKLAAKKVRRVIVCRGKVYYELLAYRREHKIDDIAIIRLEQQYPFPHADFKRERRASIPKAKEVVWCQEEPQNQGAWYRLRAYLRADIAAEAGARVRRPPDFGVAGGRLRGEAQRRAEAADRGCVRRRSSTSGEMVVAH